MKKLKKAILFILLWQGVLAANGSIASNDSLRFEVLLTSKMLDDIHFNEKFISSVDITSNRFILLSTTNRFYLVGWGGIEPMGNEVTGKISSFSFTSDNLLMAIRNNELCAFDSPGNLTRLFGLPGQSMGIATGDGIVYVYDHNKDKKKYSLYMIAKGGKYARLFEIPTPINSVIERNNSLLFATGSALFSYTIKTKELKVIVALPKASEIMSVALDSLKNRIYFSTENELYALKDSSLVTISDKFSGTLKYFNDGLLVFNAEKKFLIRITGLEDQIASKVQAMKTAVKDQPTTDILTNATIIDLVKTKLSDRLIINLINRSRVDFNLSVDSMIFLSGQNVSSEVIIAMKNAMKRKTSNANDNNR